MGLNSLEDPKKSEEERCGLSLGSLFREGGPPWERKTGGGLPWRSSG